MWMAIFGWGAFFHCVTAFGQQLPQSVYVWTMGSADQNVMMSSLAGMVNRNSDGELLLSPNNSSLPNPLFWLNRLKAAYPQAKTGSFARF